MSLAFGIVNSSGNSRDPGSGNWSSGRSETGLYRVTFAAGTFQSQPFPVVTAAHSQNLNQRRFFTITEISENDGQWFFQLIVRNENNTAANKGFSFVAVDEAPSQAATAVVTEPFDLATGDLVLTVKVPEGSSVTGGGYDLDTTSTFTLPISSGPLEDASGWRVTFGNGAQAKGTISAVYLPG